jgi:hypothetical protein
LWKAGGLGSPPYVLRFEGQKPDTLSDFHDEKCFTALGFGVSKKHGVRYDPAHGSRRIQEGHF